MRCSYSHSFPFAAVSTHPQGKCLVCREGRRVVMSLFPRLRCASSGVTEGDASSMLTELELYACNALFFQALWPAYSYDVACGGKADGWGVRACAAALTVGLIFCRLFHQVHIEKLKQTCEITEQKCSCYIEGKSRKKKVGKDLLVTFPSLEK